MSSSAKTVIARLADDLGMKEQAITTRLVEWFATADPVVQRGILRLLPPGYEAELTKIALERLAADAAKPSKGK